MDVTTGRLVEVGAQVVTASWWVTPDEYEGPREFDDYEKALRYSEETYGRYDNWRFGESFKTQGEK